MLFRSKRKSRGLGEIKWLLHENNRIAEQMEVSLTEETQAVRGEVNRHVQGSDEAIQTAKCVLFLVLWCMRRAHGVGICSECSRQS